MEAPEGSCTSNERMVRYVSRLNMPLSPHLSMPMPVPSTVSWPTNPSAPACPLNVATVLLPPVVLLLLVLPPVVLELLDEVVELEEPVVEDEEVAEAEPVLVAAATVVELRDGWSCM